MLRFIRHFSFVKRNPSIDVYHQLADRKLDGLTEYFEDLGEEMDKDGFDAEYSAGVLTLKLGSHGTFVLNKQPPNKQIWLASPISGPKRYDLSNDDRWFYQRDNSTLDELLDRELSELLKRKIKVP